MNASILAIGSELTTGQIINRNAATLSEKLKGLGIVVKAHLTVPDDKQLILNALEFLKTKSDLLFITGGLGPTSDDFTRDVVAEWAQLNMKFDQNTWEYIQERLSTRGFTVRDMQKQQCYFPEGCQILTNSQGTAHGFQLKAHELEVFVLPGPPREIEAIWQDHLLPNLKKQTEHLPKLITKAWDTIGVGESEVAFQVEEILMNRPREKFLEIGYRVHLPYVEVKLTFNENEKDFWAHFTKQIDSKLDPICVTKDFKDVAQIVAEKLAETDFTFYDYVSNGYLHNRLSPKLKLLKQWSFKQSDSSLSLDFFENEDEFLALLPYEEDKCVLAFSHEAKLVQKTIEAPMKSPLMKERKLQYFAEMALVELSRI